MSIRTIVVDDVELARERIKILLDDPEVEIVAECSNGREAVKAIGGLRPDLVFLDVQMPKVGGFEVVEAVGVEEMPAVIFVTAYDEYALRAFEVNAVDYLLKPFDQERLNRAVARAKPYVPEAMWPLLLETRSAVGDRPLIAAPTARRVLVLCPHPDDESVGCGGTIAVLADSGAEVYVVYATDGEATRGAAEPPRRSPANARTRPPRRARYWARTT